MEESPLLFHYQKNRIIMRKLLLIEDDPDLGEMLKKYLELSSFIITWARDGVEGYEFFENEVFDICLIDVMMPRLDGFSLASKLQMILNHID